MPEKKTTRYGVYNWNDNEIGRVRKTEPSKKELSPYEIPFEINLKASVPEIETEKVSVNLDVKESKVKEVIGKELDLGTGEEGEIQASQFVYNLTEENYKEKIEEAVEEVWGDAEPEEIIDLLNEVYSVEVQELGRSFVLRKLRKEIRNLRERE